MALQKAEAEKLAKEAKEAKERAVEKSKSSGSSPIVSEHFFPYCFSFRFLTA
jgi:predicted Holliday junction resolvase-like endonuclease